MMRTISLVIGLTAALGACGQQQGARIAFDGQTFRSNAKAVDTADRRDFVATVRPVSRSLAGAREAARYQGARYCIEWFGISDIDWRVSPDAEESALPISDDTLVLRGTCTE